MGQRPLVAATVVGAAVLTWMSPASAGGAQAEPPPPTVAVTPDHDLVDGQAVQVDGAGFGAGVSVMLLQCRPGSTSLSDVPVNCEVRTSVATDGSGAFSTFQTVEREIVPMAGSSAIDCGATDGACTIAVVEGFSFSSAIVEAPIAFAAVTAPAPTLAVTPATGLDDGDVVTVEGNGFPAGVDVAVAQCRRNRPLTADWCAEQPALAVTIDAAGAFTGQVTVRRPVTLPSGEIADCVGEGCVLAAAPADGSAWASAAISLVQRTILAGAFGPHTVTPQGTVHLSGATLCTPTGGELDVQGVITQTVDDRTITATFSTTTTCSWFSTWEAEVVGTRTQRFKTGPAHVTSWANEVIDPFPDDSSAGSIDVELVRPMRD